MTKSTLIGICAGLLSAVLFLSAAMGPLFAKVFFYLITPLPIFVAGLSFGWASAAIAGIAGVAGLSLFIAPKFGLAFAASQVIPPILLCYLAQLNRVSAPDPGKTQPAVEWYPVGRIVLWTAAIGAGLAILSLLLMGQDFETLQTTLKEAVQKLVEQQLPKGNEATKLTPQDVEKITQVLISLMPAFLAVSIMATLLLNLWLAARVSASFGRLMRPWPDIAALTYPAGTPLLLAASFIGASLLTNYAGVVASAISGSLYFAFVLLGLAIIHYVTRTQAWRPILLWFVYASLIIANTFVSPLIAIIGLAEPFSPLKRDFMRPPSSGPGANPPQT